MPSHRALCEKARAKWDTASSEFCSWAIANGFGNIRLNELSAAIAGNVAGEKLMAVDNVTRAALDDAESAAVQAGHAWRDQRCHVQFYSPSEIRKWAAQRRRS